jgi:ferredoxin
LSCKLCVAACPVGAIEPDGGFRFSACYDHNYREFMSGFGDFVEGIAESKDRHELRERFTGSETASMWQSLAYGPNYKAAYCIAVCPAGEDVIGPFLSDRRGYLDEIVRPLTDRKEPVYVVAGSDAEAHVTKRFPHKSVRVVHSSLRPRDARSLFRSLPLTFQRGPAQDLHATFHFELESEGDGHETVRATVRIDSGALEVEDGLVGEPDVHVRATEKVWLEIVTKKRSPVLAVLTGRLRVRGDRALLGRFAKCFPR